MVEAIQVATEGRVRALYEAGIRSSASNLPPLAPALTALPLFLSMRRGKSIAASIRKLGELIGRAAYTAVKRGLMRGAACKGQRRKRMASLKSKNEQSRRMDHRVRIKTLMDWQLS